VRRALPSLFFVTLWAGARCWRRAHRPRSYSHPAHQERHAAGCAGAVLSLRLCNIRSGTAPLQITATGLDPIGPLSLVKALRELPQGETLSVSLSFKPREEARYNETLRLQAGTTGTSIAITGRGVSPKFTLEPATPAIDMGDVLAGEEGSAQLKLTNTVSFALQCVAPFPHFAFVTFCEGTQWWCKISAGLTPTRPSPSTRFPPMPSFRNRRASSLLAPV
jgi:hypothetical protein